MPTNDGYMPLGGGGGGGGGGLEIKDLWSGDIAIATANQFVAVGTNPVPSDATWLIWNGGAFSDGTDDGPAALSTWINAATWRALTLGTAGSTPVDDSGMLIVDWGATNVGDGTPDFARRDAVIGRATGDIPLILSTNTGEAFYGASMKYTTFTEAVEASEGGGDTGGISFVDATADHHPDIPEIGDRDVSIDFGSGRIWLSGNVPIAATPAEADATDVAVTGRFRGARLIHPTLPVEHDSYYSYRDGAHHWWSYVLDPTYGGVWSGVDFDFVVERVDAFATGAIWLGEHFDSDAAAAVISEFDTTKEYYFFSQTRSRVQEITNSSYVVGTSASTQVRLFSFIAGRHVPPPTGIWYIHGQTERWPGTFAYGPAPQNSRLRIRWTGGAPDENPYGSWEIPDHWVVGTEIDSNIDGASAPVSGTDFIVFGLPAGVYDIEAVLGTAEEVATVAEFGVFLYQIQSGDDKIIAATSGGPNNMPANYGGVDGNIYHCGVRDYTITGDEELYFLVFIGEADDWRGYLTIRKRV